MGIVRDRGRKRRGQKRSCHSSRGKMCWNGGCNGNGNGNVEQVVVMEVTDLMETQLSAVVVVRW